MPADQGHDRRTFRRYRKYADQMVTAVRLDLATEGFHYEKWGGTQRCKPGDWIVRNGDDTYTVDSDAFAATYEAVTPGRFAKTAIIWARRAEEAGTIVTLDGSTTYRAGDYIVRNDPEGTDSYAVPSSEFQRMYEALD
ncbi:hypothetical protein ABI59_07545 [Acidobacteria bacterium Mor1]|nr:hypothetical protein ABI59_07545 [Acidobacteria bacterium Mor1]